MTTPPADGSGLRIGFVPGVTLTKWTTIWRDRYRSTPLEVVEVAQADQRRVLDAGEVDLCFVRLPIEVDGLHLIPLYEEAPVVWVSKEHPIAAVDEVTLADLAHETVLTEADPSGINQVALEIAVLRVPMSIARTHSRRDLTYRPVTDAEPTRIGLAWRMDDPHPLTDEFIGVVRGRTPHSSRTRQERARTPKPPEPAPAKSRDRGRGRGRPRRR
ncbi:MAG: LysR family substrate-binding domain-containing protein [Micropruina sp.]|uniref:LysR family substrate-binding domain-containing protein n=1 Tax=Micropruina sp. TaxID=2737536 RepID=UPI0039E5794D